MNYTSKELASMNGPSECRLSRKLEDAERERQFIFICFCVLHTMCIQ